MSLPGFFLFGMSDSGILFISRYSVGGEMSLTKLLFSLFLVLSVSCSGKRTLGEEVSILSFLIFGDSVANIDSLGSLKDVHLDDERPEGERVIISGKLKTRDELKIYGVLEDDSGKILTVFTELVYGWDLLEAAENTEIKVLGKLETGQGGARILKAEAVRKI